MKRYGKMLKAVVNFVIAPLFEDVVVVELDMSCCAAVVDEGAAVVVMVLNVLPVVPLF